MSTRSQLTKDLNESVKALLGKHVKILLKNVVRLETKADKTENRVLVFSPCRLFLLTAKVPTRIDCHFHYLEIESLESKRGNQLTITTSGEKTYSFLTGEDSACSNETDAMITALATAVRNIFPGIPLARVIRRVEVLPITRLPEAALGGGASSVAVGACGGFSTQYACMCDYHGLPYRDEVAWDVDTIYLSHDARELCLRDFEHLDPRDLVPIVSALEHNTWFESLRAGIGSGGPNSASRITHDTLERILHIVKRTMALERLYLDGLSLRHEFISKLSLAMTTNEACPLHTIDLSGNAVEDKGAVHLSKPLAKLIKGPVHLNLAHCGLTAKGVNAIASSLHSNSASSTSLTYLNLAGNNLRDEINNLYNFLAQPNAVCHLDLSNCDTPLESLFGALLRGCSTNLVHLNVSRNPWSTSRKCKDVPPSFKQFFMSTLCLKRLDMSGCRLPNEALKNLLLGLACNESTTDMELDLSSCALGAHGAHVLESCVHGMRCISSLDVSDNALDAELSGVVTAVGRNKQLRKLNISRNLAGCKAKHIASVVDAIVQCIQEDDCVLRELKIADSRLKQDLFALLNALGSNKCLRELDISGNNMGDAGARLLAKALQINTRLRSIYLDRNQVTLQGYSEIVYSLEKNCTLRHMPYPVHDALACAKQSLERTDNLMKRLQDLLQRNANGPTAPGAHAFRLQQSFLLGGAQQVVDRLVVQTQDAIRQLVAESCEQNDDINRATELVQDADNSRHLLLRLRDCSKRERLESKLDKCAEEVHRVVVEHLDETRDAMLNAAREQCPHIIDDRLLTELKRVSREKSHLSEQWTKDALVKGAGSDIMARVGELQLAVAAHLSDRVTDEVIDALSRSYKALAGDMNRNRPGNSDRVSLSTSGPGASPDGATLRSRLSSSGSERRDDLSVDSQMSDQSPVATPHLSSKRKSLHGRRLRPKSVVDAIEGLSADDIPSRLSSGDTDADSVSVTASGPPSTIIGEESLDSVSELPGQQLQHLVKGRPRRAKTRAPTRPMLSTVADDSIDIFWRPGSATPTGASSPAGDQSNISVGGGDTPRSRSSDSLGCSPLATRRTNDTKESPQPTAMPRSTSGDPRTPAQRPRSVGGESANGVSQEGQTKSPTENTTIENDKETDKCIETIEVPISKPVAAPRKFLPKRTEVTSAELAERRSRLLAVKNRLASKHNSLDNNHNLDDAIDV